jgi:hypothetical protein
MPPRARGRPRKEVTPEVREDLMDPTGGALEDASVGIEDCQVTQAEFEALCKENLRLRGLLRETKKRDRDEPTTQVGNVEAAEVVRQRRLPGYKGLTEGDDEFGVEPTNLGERKIRACMARIKQVISFGPCLDQSLVTRVDLNHIIGVAFYDYLQGTYDLSYYPLAATRLNMVKSVYGATIRSLKSRTSMLSESDVYLEIYPSECEAAAEILAVLNVLVIDSGVKLDLWIHMYSRYMVNMTDDFTWTLSMSDPIPYCDCSTVSQNLVTRRQENCLLFARTREFEQRDAGEVKVASPTHLTQGQLRPPRSQGSPAPTGGTNRERNRPPNTGGVGSNPGQYTCAACGKAGHHVRDCRSPHPMWIRSMMRGMRKMDLYLRGFFGMSESAQNNLIAELQLQEPRVAT